MGFALMMLCSFIWGISVPHLLPDSPQFFRFSVSAIGGFLIAILFITQGWA